jgi:hypothetical protein
MFRVFSSNRTPVWQCPWRHAFLGGIFFLLLSIISPLQAQQTSGSISGTATDASGAAIAGAQVELRNESSGDLRRAQTGHDGNFSIVSVPPGTYSVKVLASGFNPFEAKGIQLSQGDSLKIDNISLTVGDVKAQVSVISEGASVAPVDTGALSTTLNSQMIQDFTISGRDAGEFIKMMPGMGTNGGLSGNSSFNGADHVTGSNSGPVGSYSANGTIPNGGMAYILDGANLVDSNEGTQIANINPEMVSEVKFIASGYGAEFAKGPTVFQAFSKSGGNRFHGEGYLFARNSALNSIDAYQKSQGVTNAPSHYFYPGGNIGGPVIIPGTKFNKNHDKLFFWVGYEFMDQHPAGSLYQYFVPTPQMAAGNFSPSYLASLKQPGGWGADFNTPCATATAGGCPQLSNIVNGNIPAIDFDPNGLAYYKLFPQPNVNPATHSGYNYDFVNNAPQNRWEESQKIDYSINDSTKLSVAYTFQKENDSHPIDTWWAPSQALPYPSAMVANTPSKVLNISFTKVFSPTLVNETTFAYADYLNATTPLNPSAVNPAKLGMTYQGLFGAKETQIADTLSWSGALAEFQPQASFGGSAFGGKFGAHKYDPSFTDNLSKVVGTHTMKFGFYWDQSGNQQGTDGYEGTYEFETYGSTSTNNILADMLTGHAQSYAQTSSILAPTSVTTQWSLYAQDSWKVTNKLTVNYGLRFDHVGQYYNPNGNGAIVWDPATYSNAANAPADTGIEYHKIDPKVPLSGWTSPLFYIAPRFSFAYDVFGHGKTVIRAGAALFRFQVGAGTLATADANSNGQFTYTSPGLNSFTGTSTLTNLPSGAGSLNGGSIYPLALGDNRTPNTWTYNFTISQAVPGHALLELSYVGSRTRDLAIGTSNNNIGNVNFIQPGSFFKPDPKTGITPCIQGVSCTNLTTQDYYPLVNYQNIIIETHGSYSNYNSVQASLVKHAGPVTFLTNYTFGKVLGTIDGVSGNGSGAGSTVDSTSLSKNYGVLAYDHTQIFNAGYSVNLPKPFHDNKILKAAVNGWQLSGWTGIQSGTPLQPNTGGNLNVQWSSNVSNSSYLGTNMISLQPQLICNPKANLSSGQYFNTACFAPPAPGTQGTEMWPFIHGPAVINSDLSLFKNFQLGETTKIQFRLEAYNFLNHPNAAFGVQNNSDIQLNFSTPSGALSQTNTNVYTTGKPEFVVGQRQIQLAVKFYF